MLRQIGICVLFSVSAALAASADKVATGTVLEHTGAAGEFIVTRDDVVIWLSEGDELFHNDILRTENQSEATVIFNGCELTLSPGMEVTLDDDFCAVFAATDGPSLAMLAAEGGTAGASGFAGAAAPLNVGGIVLAAGGLVDAVNGGSGGTASEASVAAGAPAANSTSN